MPGNESLSRNEDTESNEAPGLRSRCGHTGGSDRAYSSSTSSFSSYGVG